MVLFAASCTKDEKKIYFEGGTNPILSASLSSNAVVPLSYTNESTTNVLTLKWTNPNYRFTTGVSSQNVSYQIEIDTAGANFSSPNKKVVGVSKDLSKDFTSKELNDILLNSLLLSVGKQYDIEFRVISLLTNNTVALTSKEVYKAKATPYAIPPKVELPSTGELYIVGGATQGGWSNPVPVPSQKFTKLSETLYQIELNLVGGGAYLLIPINGSWSKYCVADDTVSGLADGGDFGKEKAKDIPAPAVAGKYRITVDFQRGKFTVVKI